MTTQAHPTVEIDYAGDGFTVTLCDDDMCIATVWDFDLHAEALAHALTMTDSEHIKDYTEYTEADAEWQASIIAHL